MGTNVRAAVSTKNKYWIEAHRYHELRHFCLQYPEWKRIYASLDGLPSQSPIFLRFERNGVVSDPTAKYVEARMYFFDRIKMVDQTAEDVAGTMAKLLVKAITETVSYECLNAKFGVPCCRDAWYILYRKFFWLLDKARK